MWNICVKEDANLLRSTAGLPRKPKRGESSMQTVAVKYLKAKRSDVARENKKYLQMIMADMEICTALCTC